MSEKDKIKLAIEILTRAGYTDEEIARILNRVDSIKGWTR